MLGISGQAKNLSKREFQGEKLPIIPSGKCKVKEESNKKPAKKLVANKNSSRKIVKESSRHNPSNKKSDFEQCRNFPIRPETILEVAKKRLAMVAGSYGDTGTVKVKFNHYNKSFPIHNGVLLWTDIDDEYSISFVYRGNFVRKLERIETGGGDTAQYATHDDGYNYFIDLQDKSSYRLELIEDPEAGVGAEGMRLYTGPIKASPVAATVPAVKSTSRAMDSITAELKSIAVTELNDSHAKDLIERRDLEDILYSG